jgi:hypothetical protein
MVSSSIGKPKRLRPVQQLLLLVSHRAISRVRKFNIQARHEMSPRYLAMLVVGALLGISSVVIARTNTVGAALPFWISAGLTVIALSLMVAAVIFSLSAKSDDRS